MRITIDLEDNNILTPKMLNAMGSIIAISHYIPTKVDYINTLFFDYNNFKKLTPNGVNVLRGFEKSDNVIDSSETAHPDHITT